MSRKVVVERCWMLVGRRQGPFWYARRVQRSVGKPTSVAFDADWALAREEAKGDLVGFYHTHPSGLATPSVRDDRTMAAWVACFGKPLLCVIEADDRPRAYMYDGRARSGVELRACERLPRGIVLMFDDRTDDETEEDWRNQCEASTCTKKSIAALAK